MKRNWDLIRKILFKLEAKADNTSWLEPTDISHYDEATVSYHYKLLQNAGLIETENISNLEGENYAATSLTWQGYEFLDQIRNESIWNKVKSTVKSKSLDLSFDVIKTVATTVIKSMLL